MNPEQHNKVSILIELAIWQINDFATAWSGRKIVRAIPSPWRQWVPEPFPRNDHCLPLSRVIWHSELDTLYHRFLFTEAASPWREKDCLSLSYHTTKMTHAIMLLMIIRVLTDFFRDVTIRIFCWANHSSSINSNRTVKTRRYF